MYKPIYHKVSEKYTASVCRFLEVDVDESPELAELFNVAKIPTTIIIKNGEVVATFVEILSEKALTELIESYPTLFIVDSFQVIKTDMGTI